MLMRVVLEGVAELLEPDLPNLLDVMRRQIRAGSVDLR